jgi:plastocyanin
MTRSLTLRRFLLATLLLGAAAVALVLRAAPAGASGTQVLTLSAKPHMVLRFNTSRLHAHPGRIEIVMHNPRSAGMSHGIALEGHGVDRDGPIVKPGHTSTLTVTLTRRGRYEYYCPLPGHKQAGMRGTLTIS